METIQSGVINSSQDFIKSYNGQKVKLANQPASHGVSGKTELYTLAAGGGLYLEQSDIKAD